MTDTSSLMRAFSVSAEAKISAVVGGGSASTSFSQQTTLDTTGLNIAVDIKIVQGADYLAPTGLASAIQPLHQIPTVDHSSHPSASPVVTSSSDDWSIVLTEKAASLARNDPFAFRQQCGDSFVSAIRKGSGIQGVYVIAIRSASEKTDLSAKIGGSYGPFSGSDTVQQTIQHLESESRVSIRYFQLGGEALPIARNDAEFRKLITDLGSVAKAENATPFEVVLVSYRELPNFPRERDVVTIDMEAMADQYYRLYSLDVQIDDILTKQKQYFFDRSVSAASTQHVQDSIKKDMTALRNALNACSGQPERCSYPGEIARDDYVFRMRLPVRNEAVPDWVGAQNAQQELETANNNIESRKRWLMANPGVIAFSASHDLPDNLIAKSTAEASYLQKKINDLTRSADSTEARYLLWIELPVRERCRALDQLLCRNGDQLSAMHQLMLQQRP